MAGIEHDTKEAILDQFPFDSGSLPVRYLGLPLLTKRMTSNDYNPLLEKIRERIGSWTTRYLSFAGRLQLIGSVIHSLTNFWMSAFRLPKACLQEIDSLCSAFLWSGPDLNPRKSKIAWHDVCRPKSEGGLGLKPLSEANKVCCLKLIWRILSARSSLWVNWVHCYLIRKGSFWSIKDTTSLGSWMWGKLLKYRELARGLVRMEVNNGAQTSFWYDVWHDKGRLLDLTGLRGRIDLGIPLHTSVETVLCSHQRRNHRTAEYNGVEAVIEEQRAKGPQLGEDKALWRAKDDKFRNRFNSKDTWSQIRNASPVKDWWESLWFQYHTPKYAFHAWIAMHDRLATGERMMKWNMGVNGLCIFCSTNIETRDHIYFECSYSREIWRDLTQHLLLQRYTEHWEEILVILRSDTHEFSTRWLVRYVFQATLHAIWRERNNRRHGEKPQTTTSLIRHLDQQVRNRISTIREGRRDSRLENTMETWFSSR